MCFAFSKSGLSKMLVILVVVVIVLGSVGVGYFVLTQLAAPTPSPNPSPSPTPSPSPSPTAAPTPSPSPSPTAAPTPSPSPSPTAAPTPPPTPTPIPVVGWNKTYGGTSEEVGLSVVQTSDGGYAMVGYTESFGAGSLDFYFVKTDAAGNMLWNKTYGGTNYEMGRSVVQTGDGGYAIAGNTYSFGAGGDDVYLVKTDAAGNMLWNKTYGGTDSDGGYSVVQTADGGYAIAGETRSFGAGETDFYLVKTDAAGTMLWNKTYGGTYVDRGFSVVETGDGGFAIAGRTNSFGAGGYDVYLVRTDASGTMLWNQTYGGKNWDYGYSVVETGDGGFAIAGNTGSFGAGGLDVYLVRTDASGTMLWNQTYGGTNGDYGQSVVQTVDGGFAIVGYTGSFGAGGDDVYLVKTDAAGNMQWNQTYGGTEHEDAYSVFQTSDGGYIISGGTASYGVGDWDFYLVKTDSAGNIQ